MQSRGPGCFDNRYYLQKNPDLKVIPTVLELWDHFVMMGQFEGRSFRCRSPRRPASERVLHQLDLIPSCMLHCPLL